MLHIVVDFSDFTARRYASAVFVVIVSVCSSVCLPVRYEVVLWSK